MAAQVSGFPAGKRRNSIRVLILILCDHRYVATRDETIRQKAPTVADSERAEADSIPNTIEREFFMRRRRGFVFLAILMALVSVDVSAESLSAYVAACE